MAPLANGHVTPPCELLEDPKPQWQQTYVVLGDRKAEAAFEAFAHSQAVCGPPTKRATKCV